MTPTPRQLWIRFGFAATLVVCVALALHCAPAPPQASPPDRRQSFGTCHDRVLVDSIAEDADEDDGGDARCRAVAHASAVVVTMACGARDCPSLAFVAAFPPDYDARPLRAPPQ